MAALSRRLSAPGRSCWFLSHFGAPNLPNFPHSCLPCPGKSPNCPPSLPAPLPPLSRCLSTLRGLPPAANPRPRVVLLPGQGEPRRAMAGHNRWSKVRNVKGPRDAERSRTFQRLAQMLRAAARAGGADPSLNPSLAAALQLCRSHNMPKASIEAAIRPQDPKSQLLLEVKGPGGSALLLELQTENPRRSQQELRGILNKFGGSLAEGVRQSFERVGVVRVAAAAAVSGHSGHSDGHPDHSDGHSGHSGHSAMEAALEVALLAGAQDVVAEGEDELKFLCSPSALADVQRGLLAAGLRPLSAAVEFEPRARLELSEGSRGQLQRLLQALAEWPELVRLYHNVR